MRKHLLLGASLLMVAAVIALAGCPKPQPTGAPTGPAAPAASAPSSATGAAATGAGEDYATCPVLGTTMPRSKMIPVEYKGKTYYMCCQDCVPKFKADPEKYIQHPATPLPPSNGM